MNESYLGLGDAAATPRFLLSACGRMVQRLLEHAGRVGLLARRKAGALLLGLSTLMGGALAFAEIEYAQNFEVERFSTHRLIKVRNTWVGAGDAKQVYALVPKGDPLPALPKGAVVVRTPVERLVIMGTVYLGPIHELDLYDALVGAAHVDFVNNPEVHERVKSGRIKQVQSGSIVDIESMMMLKPDLILTSTTGNATFDVHPQMIRAGLPVAVTAGYMESHPLARTEWVKFLAEFFDKRSEAETYFDDVAKRYEELVGLAATAKERPTVMSNAPYGGVWHVPGGDSYTAQSIADAGGDYVWSGIDSRGGVALDFEVILKEAGNADFWLHPSHYESIGQLLQSDQRFALFEAVQKGNVYNNSVRVNEHGGNDVFERGIAHPEEVLADLIKIFHPELLPDHQFVYYERLK